MHRKKELPRDAERPTATIVILPYPEVGEMPAYFRQRFDEWRRTRPEVLPPYKFPAYYSRHPHPSLPGKGES